eukprot:Plantae.Rhodophyta-Hildenbrandia_rubra.ctg334.p1 GENE.Plantae.Rhodophyta-Hildenbrandia_rubra.ctg334~~Plantae.Rhodophyta-Hildenbrandia_rubra.ctg334.p1  ORF type:complete len:368 (-),score=40.77 Plantae.Rhodophyta-Hildenbrandia_rubra.ctg334:549-1652(-)
MQETRAKHLQRIVIFEIDARSFEVLLDFVYSGDVSLKSIGEALLVLKAGNMYQIRRLGEVTQGFVEKTMEVGECIDVWNHADYYGLVTLQRSAFELMEGYFGELSIHSSFAACSQKLLFSLLRSNDPMLRSEIAIVDGIIRWIDADKPRRAADFERALSSVRLQRMSSSELVEAGRKAGNFGQCGGFMNKLLQTLRSTSQRECSMGVSATYSDLLESEAIQRNQRRLLFGLSTQGVRNSIRNRQRLHSETIEVPDRNLKLQFQIDPHNENEEGRVFIGLYLKVELQSKEDMVEDPRKALDYAGGIASHKKPSMRAGLHCRSDFTAHSALGMRYFLPVEELLNEENGYFTPDKDEITVLGRVLIPCIS